MNGHVLRALPALFRVGFAEAIAYRAELIIWILTGTMPLVMLALWDAVAQGGPVAGFDRGAFAAYYTLTLVARQLTGAWVLWELNADIRTGRLSSQLLRPMHPLWLHAARILSAIPFRLLVIAPLLVALAWWRPDMGLAFDPARIAAFFASCALAWGLAFTWQAVFACIAFWADQSLGLWSVWLGLWSLFSGYLLPVALLPAGVADVAAWLPFHPMLGIPVEIGAGLLPASQILAGLGVQAAWLAFTLALVSVLWRRGVRRYGAFGA